MNTNLYMVLLGCKPSGRYTEQHDLFFGIGLSLSALKDAMINFWPEADGKLHVDAWREVKRVEGFKINIEEREKSDKTHAYRLFFVNLGGYRGQDFEEYHYKQLVVAKDVAEATRKAKTSQFFLNHVSPHVDDKYGLDVDDIFAIEDALPAAVRERYQIVVTGDDQQAVDEVNIGYLKFSDL